MSLKDCMKRIDLIEFVPQVIFNIIYIIRSKVLGNDG